MCEGLSALGVKLVTSATAAEMRLCTSLVDERYGETTEIIEPWSAEVGKTASLRSGRFLLKEGSALLQSFLLFLLLSLSSTSYHIMRMLRLACFVALRRMVDIHLR